MHSEAEETELTSRSVTKSGSIVITAPALILAESDRRDRSLETAQASSGSHGSSSALIRAAAVLAAGVLAKSLTTRR